VATAAAPKEDEPKETAPVDLSAIEVEKKGKKEGAWKYYYESGTIFEEINYKSGILNGAKTTWYSFGGLWSKVHFKGGIQHGVFEYYDKKGNLTKKVKYEKGKLEQ
jgi:antitoxin component YwqK of YwqJK toxin-antitoxin module